MLRRFGRTEVLILLWFLIVGFAWLGPTLWGRAIFAHDADLAIYYYSILSFYSAALHAGQSFLWIPGIFSGFPIYLSQSGGFFDPVNILIFKTFYGVSGVHVRLVLDIIVTVWMSFLASRALGLSRTASLLVGPSYLLAMHLRFLSNPIIANTLFLLPLLIYTSTGVIRNTLSPFRAGIICGIGLGWAILGGYTQLVVYALLLAGIFIGGHLWWKRNELLMQVRRLTFQGSITLFLGIVIASPFLLPAREFLPLSARSLAAPLEQATLKVIEPGDLMLSIVPDYLYFPYVTSGRKPMYVGALWFLLAIGACIVALRAVRRREVLDEIKRGAIVASATALFSLITAFKWSPIFLAMSYLPVIGLFRFPFRFMFLGIFFVALLGGYGFDMAHTIIRDRLWRVILWLISVSTVCFIIAVATLHLGGDALIRVLAILGRTVLQVVMRGGDVVKYENAITNGLQAYREFFSFSNVGAVLGIGILVISCAALIAISREWIRWGQGRRVIIGLVSFTVLCIPVSQWTRFVPQEAIGMRPHALNAHVDESASLYRMYSFLPAVSARGIIPPQYKLDVDEETALHDIWIMGSTPNFHLYSGVASVDGYDQFEALDYLDAMYAIGGEHAASYGAGTNEERIARLLSRLDIFGMMGGRYIVSGTSLESPALTSLGTERVSSYAIPLYLYEYHAAMPIYYVATTTQAYPHTSFRQLLDEEISFERVTYLDCEDCTSEARTPTLIRLTERENGRYVFQIQTNQERFLVLSESYLPGWTVHIDGAVVEPIRANGLYMAARVPAGAHDITFEYQGLRGELRVLRGVGLVK